VNSMSLPTLPLPEPAHVALSTGKSRPAKILCSGISTIHMTLDTCAFGVKRMQPKPIGIVQFGAAKTNRQETTE